MDLYLYIKAAHIIAGISWMAGLLYLPRLFVYHANPSNSEELNLTFVIMEKRLLRYIMNPSMILSWFFGILLIIDSHSTVDLFSFYFLIKILSVILLTSLHGYFSICRRRLEVNKNNIKPNNYKILNEIPTVLLIIIIIMIIVRPF